MIHYLNTWFCGRKDIRVGKEHYGVEYGEMSELRVGNAHHPITGITEITKSRVTNWMATLLVSSNNIAWTVSSGVLRWGSMVSEG